MHIWLHTLLHEKHVDPCLPLSDILTSSGRLASGAMSRTAVSLCCAVVKWEWCTQRICGSTWWWLENNIRRETAAISEDVLQATFGNMKRRVQLCMDSGGEHFQHLLQYRQAFHESRYAVIYACSKFNEYSLRYSHFLVSSTERITLYQCC